MGMCVGDPTPKNNYTTNFIKIFSSKTYKFKGFQLFPWTSSQLEQFLTSHRYGPVSPEPQTNLVLNLNHINGKFQASPYIHIAEHLKMYENQMLEIINITELSNVKNPYMVNLSGSRCGFPFSSSNQFIIVCLWHGRPFLSRTRQ